MSPALAKRTIRDIDLAGRRVFLRVDYNVQVEGGAVFDDLRLRESLPTLRYLREAGARIVICSHRGRPRGRTVEALRNAPVAERLAGLLGAPVAAAPDCAGPAAEAAAAALEPGGLLLLENVRFHPGEEANDPAFAAQLAALADVYVCDAFGSAHRPHASMVGVAQRLPAVAGLLMEREIEYLTGLTEHPERPFGLVLGGAKVADKIGILHHLCDQADVICAGGVIANTLLTAQGVDVADSLRDPEGARDAGRVLEKVASRPDLRLYLPVDAVVGFGAADREHVRKAPIDHVPSAGASSTSGRPRSSSSAARSRRCARSSGTAPSAGSSASRSTTARWRWRRCSRTSTASWWWEGARPPPRSSARDWPIA